jgi:hypothetical protein
VYGLCVCCIVCFVLVCLWFAYLMVVVLVTFLEARLAQWIAYQTSNLGVAGSSPASRTLLLKTAPHTHQHQRSFLLPLRDQCKSHSIRSCTHHQYQCIYYFRQPQRKTNKVQTTYEDTVFIQYLCFIPLKSWLHCRLHRAHRVRSDSLNTNSG